MSRRIFPVTLAAAGIEVLMAELRPSEFINAMKLAGNDQATSVRGRRVSREAVRMSIREINGETVTHIDLSGDGWRKHFPRTRYSSMLAAAWGQIHLPTEEDLELVQAGMDVTLDGEAEQWTVQLPGGREVVLEEQDDETLDAALRAAELGSRSAAAQAFAAALENVRRALRRVDGVDVTLKELTHRRWDELFSVAETYLLGHAFAVIHGGEEELVVGEARPVSGTGSRT